LDRRGRPAISGRHDRPSTPLKGLFIGIYLPVGSAHRNPGARRIHPQRPRERARRLPPPRPDR